MIVHVKSQSMYDQGELKSWYSMALSRPKNLMALKNCV